jgi:serine/threonine protein kinase
MTQAAQTETLQPGTRLRHNRYEIEYVLGRGGFGITYRARDHKTGERVALKELFPDGNATRDSSGRVALVSGSEDDFLRLRVTFEAEADLLASLRSQAIVAVIEFFEENQTAYLVMEYLEGETLEERIARQPLNDTEARDILGTLLEALEEVHNLGVLHRDIKPANIVLSTHGPELIDFGTAMKGIGREVKVVDRILTPAYAPLEQYAGESKFGPPTDLYALAATFYEAVTGVRPASALERSRGVPLKPIRVIAPNISSLLAETLESALKLRVDQRPKSARFMLNQIRKNSLDVDTLNWNPNPPQSPQVSSLLILALVIMVFAFSFFALASFQMNYMPEATGFFLVIAGLSLVCLLTALTAFDTRSNQSTGKRKPFLRRMLLKFFDFLLAILTALEKIF